MEIGFKLPAVSGKAYILKLFCYWGTNQNAQLIKNKIIEESRLINVNNKKLSTPKLISDSMKFRKKLSHS